MPPKKGPLPDSIRANPEGARLIHRIISTGIAKPGDKAKKWYHHPSYCATFSSIDPEKFRKRFMAVMKEHIQGSPSGEYHTYIFFNGYLFLTTIFYSAT